MANVNISLTSKDGLTLKTAQSFVKEDIGVIPKLQDYTVTSNRMLTAKTVECSSGYAGFGKITIPRGTIVNVGGTKTVTANGSYSVESYETVKVAIPEYDGTVNF